MSSSDNKPKPLPPLTEKDRERFERYTDKTPGQGPNGDCWTWTGARSKKGYGQMTITLADGTKRSIRTHRLGFYFHYGRDCYPNLCTHKCNNPACIRGEHLEEGDQKANIQYALSLGRMATGDRNGSVTHPEKLKYGPEHWTAIMPERTYKEHEALLVNRMRKLHRIRPHFSYRTISRWFGIHRNTVGQILNYKTHQYIPYDDSVEIPDPIDKNYFAKRKLEEDDILEIYEMLRSGMSQSEIARIKGVSQSYVSKIHRQKKWQKLPT